MVCCWKSVARRATVLALDAVSSADPAPAGCQGPAALSVLKAVAAASCVPPKAGKVNWSDDVPMLGGYADRKSMPVEGVKLSSTLPVN